MAHIEVETWDDIIVGAGSSGAVLAARLTENAQRRVLLIEAGSDFSVDDVPEVLDNANAPLFSGYNWNYVAHLRDIGLAQDVLRSASVLATASPWSVSFLVFLGRVVDGALAANGAITLRSSSRDFDTWAEYGNGEWR